MLGASSSNIERSLVPEDFLTDFFLAFVVFLGLASSANRSTTEMCKLKITTAICSSQLYNSKPARG